ncbi:sensor histidine kinase [Chitinophaga varians]|uniref:sensor histidine kinase n=1 Tax=Chitinophaga varians TaxID=2202339 RepID=UPI00165F67A5|nr:HAMP domain-containing sensor histidine kinase [Chitinophaga varians]MBC9909689.1 HAMP domain-containing histidine kinase [Chitinophaga varians]
MSKLLNKSLKIFILYAGIVLAGSIPAYYLIVDLIWEHELKEHNLIVSETIKQNLQSLSLSDEELAASIVLWNKLRPETQLQPVASLLPDSTYNIYRKNKYIPAKGKDRFQGLVTYFSIRNKPFRLTLETNMEESHETMMAIAAVTVMFFLILLGGFIFINRRIAERLWRPFYNSLGKIQSFNLHKPKEIHFDHTGIEEFETLNHHLHKLITGNIASYQQQKEFTQLASHELQTPLSVIKFKLDLLHQSKPMTEEQSDIIDQAHQALAKVTRVNKNLLLLAKIENSQFPEKELIDLPALIIDYMPFLQDFLDDKQLQLNITGSIQLSVNKTLLEILLANLFMNAIRYSEPGGTILVSLDEHRLEMANTGDKALDAHHLFRRFGLSAPHAAGTGLGLAIVHEVCQLYGWRECYHFENGFHFFSIQWP